MPGGGTRIVCGEDGRGGLPKIGGLPAIPFCDGRNGCPGTLTKCGG